MNSICMDSVLVLTAELIDFKAASFVAVFFDLSMVTDRLPYLSKGLFQMIISKIFPPCGNLCFIHFHRVGDFYFFIGYRVFLTAAVYCSAVCQNKGAAILRPYNDLCNISEQGIVDICVLPCLCFSGFSAEEIFKQNIAAAFQNLFGCLFHFVKILFGSFVFVGICTLFRQGFRCLSVRKLKKECQILLQSCRYGLITEVISFSALSIQTDIGKVHIAEGILVHAPQFCIFVKLMITLRKKHSAAGVAVKTCLTEHRKRLVTPFRSPTCKRYHSFLIGITANRNSK